MSRIYADSGVVYLELPTDDPDVCFQVEFSPLQAEAIANALTACALSARGIKGSSAMKSNIQADLDRSRPETGGR